jgi:hypothetical protein
MQIKLDEEQIEEVMFTGLLSLEESFPNDKKLSKAIKRVLSYTMAPSDWEMIYDRNWGKYSDDNDRDDITFGVKSEQVEGYDLGGYDFDSPIDSYTPSCARVDSYSPEYTFSITPSPEEVKIEKSRKGNK